MSAEELTSETPEKGPEHDLAECWADFTKALSIYPATNVRVREKLADIVDAHKRSLEKAADDVARRTAGIAVLFRNGVLVLGNDELEIPEGSSLEWLQARLDRASLAGLEFMENIDEEALIEFTKHLLGIYLRRDGPTDFESLWPDRYAGLVMVDRRFEGRFGASGEDAPYSGGHAHMGGVGDDQRNVVDVLLEDADIAGPLARLEASASQDEDGDAETFTVADLMDRIVKLMPAEAMKDRKTLVAAVREVLRALEERLEAEKQPDALSEITNDMTLSTLLYSVSRSHFSRTGPEETEWAIEDAMSEAGAPKRKVGHAGDEKIDEDIDAFLDEWAALPAKTNVDLSLSHAEVRGEEAAVLLHYLVHAPSAVNLEGLYPTLDKVLDEPGEEVLDVLRQYLQTGDGSEDEEGDEPTAGPSGPLLEFLRRTNRVHLLRECGVFTVEWVVDAFPQCFVAYIESVNARKQGDIDELNAVCARVGNERMLRAKGALMGEGSKLPAETARDLLQSPDIARMAFVRLLMDWHGPEITKEVAAFLRKVELDTNEAFLLDRAIDPRFMTAEYLRGLVDLHLGRTRSAHMHHLIADVLCRHVRGTRESETGSPARIASIKSLADYPTTNSTTLLRELSRWNLFALKKLEPAFIRRLARSVRRNAKAA